MQGKTAIVTGAGSGIGRAIAEALAASGHAVLAVGRTAGKLDETRSRIAQAGGTCEVHAADVADPDAVAGAIAAADERWGRIDVLVNNAAQLTVGPVAQIDLAGFDAMLRANCAAVVYACQAAWPVMKRCGGGTIVNISSMAAVDPFPSLAAYGATKAFVNLLTKGMAAEGKADAIRVFAVGPGAVETEMLRGAFPDFPAQQTLSPAAIADVVVTLTQPACRYCTGQTVYVNA